MVIIFIRIFTHFKIVFLVSTSSTPSFQRVQRVLMFNKTLSKIYEILIFIYVFKYEYTICTYIPYILLVIKWKYFFCSLQCFQYYEYKHFISSNIVKKHFKNFPQQKNKNNKFSYNILLCNKFSFSPSIEGEFIKLLQNLVITNYTQYKASINQLLLFLSSYRCLYFLLTLSFTCYLILRT